MTETTKTRPVLGPGDDIVLMHVHLFTGAPSRQAPPVVMPEGRDFDAAVSDMKNHGAKDPSFMPVGRSTGIGMFIRTKAEGQPDRFEKLNVHPDGSVTKPLEGSSNRRILQAGADGILLPAEAPAARPAPTRPLVLGADDTLVVMRVNEGGYPVKTDMPEITELGKNIPAALRAAADRSGIDEPSESFGVFVRKANPDGVPDTFERVVPLGSGFARPKIGEQGHKVFEETARGPFIDISSQSVAPSSATPRFSISQASIESFRSRAGPEAPERKNTSAPN